MRIKKYIILLLALVLVGCGVKKRAVQTVVEEPDQAPAWHTCLIQNARATVTKGTERYSANVTMQTVRDSMLVISVMPMLGMEMLRLEATPLEMTGIDKIHGQYAELSFAEINRRLHPSLNWDELQQVCTAELPAGSERARLIYTFGDDVIEIVIEYPARKLDVPVRVYHQPLVKYRKVDVSRWL